jgi:hypothetical protein
VVVDRNPPLPARYPPLVKSVLGAPMSLALDRPQRTSVKDSGTAVPRSTPTLAGVRAATAGLSLMALHLIPRAAQATGQTAIPVGVATLTRLASGTVGAVANARPAPAAARRLAAMSAALVSPPAPGSGPLAAPSTADRGGATIHEGELAVITIANRPAGASPDRLAVSGGATRVLCMAAGGRVLDDQVAGADGQPAEVTMPWATERVAVVALGSSAAAGGSLPGWCAGQSLPAIGWGAAIGGGVVVTSQGSRIPAHRERADGGWVTGRELTSASLAVTAFTDAVNAIAVVIDDQLGGDAAASVSMRLLDAVRTLDVSGHPVPPQVLVDGVRSILLFAVETTGPNPRVFVEGCGGGQLAGVAGSTVGVPDLAAVLAASGVAAAVQQPLVGGPGLRQVSIILGDDSAPPPAPPPPAPPPAPEQPPSPAPGSLPTAKPPPAKGAGA